MININKAKLLNAIAESGSPVTFQMLLHSFADEMSGSVIWDNLQRMIIDRYIEEKSFKKEGIDPQDYRMSDVLKGRAPRHFYIETERGMRQLEYLRKRRVI